MDKMAANVTIFTNVESSKEVTCSIDGGNFTRKQTQMNDKRSFIFSKVERGRQKERGEEGCSNSSIED